MRTLKRLVLGIVSTFPLGCLSQPSGEPQYDSDLKRPVCPGCDVPQGALHAMFCTRERCPFCGGQLASCECIFTVLKLTDAERLAYEAYLDDSVEPLRSVVERWKRALEAEGRVPYAG